jgi:hypothetical protein
MMETDTDRTVLHAIRSYLSRDRWGDQLLLDLCDYMLGGHLSVRHGHVPKAMEPLDALKFTPATIDWEMEWPPITNTCQLYLHSLEPMKTLVQGYEVEPRLEFIDLAVEITRSWLEYADRETVTRFTWYDHAAADRTGLLIYLAETIDQTTELSEHLDFVPTIRTSLEQHAAFLAAPANYTTQNHGTMMDRSLYLVGHYLNDHPDSARWRATAVKRLREAIDRDYSADMVNLENSSSYHLFNFDLYVSIEKNLLAPFGDTLAPDFDERTALAIRFLVQLSKPDHAFPMIGDGSRATLDAFPRHPSYEHVKGHPQLRHVLSDGKKGKPPARLFAVYRDEGYAFARTSWDAAKRDEITYLSFRAGRVLHNHKHADDLSFTLYAHGRDIFVDSGTFTYQPGDYRRYFVSAAAHNTLLVDGETYPTDKTGRIADVSILDSGSTKDYHFIVARNDAYKGVLLTRALYFFRRSGRVLIVDDAHSEREHTYSQMFHLSHHLGARSVTVDGGVATAHAGELDVRVRQSTPCVVTVHHGSEDHPGPGLVSEQFNVTHPTTALEFAQVGKTVRFVTAISADKDAAEPFTVKVGRRGIQVRDGDVEVRVNPRGRSGYQTATSLLRA